MSERITQWNGTGKKRTNQKAHGLFRAPESLEFSSSQNYDSGSCLK